ncbi:hypothetical protein [Subtercola lobariae]|uniref:SpaA-like prealbumin fold domain-containing protein n=1 Tax=Subtercola lobariae TaxID=1588641 RepID=A0A917BAH2_9MICO|nr:hypothetical protein [Subtercola lobariae]GGF34540.1 hypothetical protein GCM10011399_29550 [Subtercola lobariae]
MKKTASAQESAPSHRASARTRIGAVLAAAALAVAALALPAAASAAPAVQPAATSTATAHVQADASGPVGCGYGTGGPFANTLCWIDMSSYNDTIARSDAGQPFSITLPGGYTTTFTAHTSGTQQVHASGFPTWTYGDHQGAIVGNEIYLGTPGMPALYQGYNESGLDGVSTISLTNISVKDSDGNAVQGWQFVGVDAEATAPGETITFTSDSGVKEIATYSPGPDGNGCPADIVQVDPNTITCTGSATAQGPYGTALVSSTQPTTFTQTMTTGQLAAALEGVAFAFQSAQVQLDANVVNRAAAGDDFTVSVTSAESSVVGTASTAGGSSASTGQLIVLPRERSADDYTLSLTGNNLAAYTPVWSCSVNGTVDPSLAATGVTQLSVSPAAGDLVACTVSLDVASAPTATPTPSASASTSTPVPAADSSTSGLAATGLDASGIALGAAVLLLLGVGAFTLRRRTSNTK